MNNLGNSLPKADFLVKNASQLATPVARSEFGPGNFCVIEDATLAACKGEIVWQGESSQWRRNVQLVDSAVVIDASNKTVTPGFVDCHTHPVFWSTREDEFSMRIAGKTYEDIAKAGGGIRSSVRHLRGSSKEQLVQVLLPRLDRFLAGGTTTIEAKSGYGLTQEDEIKSLEVIEEVNGIHPIELVPTFLGAHETPDEFRYDKRKYLDLVINEMMPVVKERKLAEFCDVFCESHVFDVAESRRVLQAASEIGFGLKIHADQLTRTGGGALAAELGAISADHLEHSTRSDWEGMAESHVTPVMLPGAVFFLGKQQYAAARDMIECGLPVAVATDFNPGTCMSESMPLMLTLSCLNFKMTPAEALTAATYHAALAVNRGNLLGSLAVGKKADLVVWNAPNYLHLAYHFGVSLTDTVVKSGKVVWEMKPEGSRKK